ncbi:hypothetical protein MNB_SUP05-SYMBIONT-5-278 [hydrothermal vent metagenome]|uniref:Uncharacterized protein n=1 Tax=hydrothermal vent metagenome TaxID=652676 RepID=A0A1W1E6N0_9ZZZZ
MLTIVFDAVNLVEGKDIHVVGETTAAFHSAGAVCVLFLLFDIVTSPYHYYVETNDTRYL